MDNEYKITVITPVFNADGYLQETLECIAGQTIGMDNIQYILVNGGITDSGDAVCRGFADRYPESVVYAPKEAGGAAAARNEGIKLAEGRYVVFLNAGDLWDNDAFEKICGFFESGSDSFDVCSCVMDEKYREGGGIADLRKEPEAISLAAGSAVFRNSAVRNKKFDKIAYGEDLLFLNTVLLDDPKIGILSDAGFHCRKNSSLLSGASSEPGSRSWHLDAPECYLELENRSGSMYGEVLKFIQYAIMDDIRTGLRCSEADNMSDDEKRLCLSRFSKALKGIDLDVLMGTEGIDQYKKLYLADLREGRPLMPDAVRDGFRFYHEGVQILSLRAGTMLFVNVFDIAGGLLRIEGLIRVNTIRATYSFFMIDDGGKRYDPLIERNHYSDIKGLAGETIVEGEVFKVCIPVSAGTRLSFMLETCGETMELRPAFDPYIGIVRGQRNNYCVKNGYIIKLRKNVLSFDEDKKRTRLVSEGRLARELARKKEPNLRHDRLLSLKTAAAVNDSRLKERVAFVTARSDELEDNLSSVYSELQVPKTAYCSKMTEADKDKYLEAARTVFTSKVVVTDDYYPVFRDTRKKEGQYYVQLWHAAGAFKKFGSDGSAMYSGKDAMHHKDYDLVTVSSEYVRDIYADAFQIDKKKVKALGVPRTDRFFDDDYIRETKESVFERMPDIKDRQIIVYAPSFRGRGSSRVYMPAVDYKKIDGALNEDQILMLCPHPLMPRYEGVWNCDKIRLVQDVSTNDIMIAADVLLTDYSSVIFDYSLLDKPMAFFCYDYDEYDRDFYLDYDKDLPGDIFRTEDELIDYLRNERFETDERLNVFRDRYMSACDGNSSKRIAEAITDFLHEQTQTHNGPEK